MHMRVTLKHHHFVNLDRACFADSAQIVAFEIDQHYVFGALFWVRE